MFLYINAIKFPNILRVVILSVFVFPKPANPVPKLLYGFPFQDGRIVKTFIRI